MSLLSTLVLSTALSHLHSLHHLFMLLFPIPLFLCQGVSIAWWCIVLYYIFVLLSFCSSNALSLNVKCFPFFVGTIFLANLMTGGGNWKRIDNWQKKITFKRYLFVPFNSVLSKASLADRTLYKDIAQGWRVCVNVRVSPLLIVPPYIRWYHL